MSFNPNEELREACRSSLHFLSTEILGYNDWDTVHDDLEVFIRRPSAKKAILLPRGHLKTSIATIALPVQEILKNQNIRILLANQVWDRARDMLSEIKAHLSDHSALSQIFGGFSSERWNQDGITVRGRTVPHKEPTIFTTGVEAETTGGHYDLIILDDLMGLQNSQTPEQRQKVKRFRRSMINLLEPGGRLLEIGTRWHLDDTFAEIFEKESEYYDVHIREVVEDGKIIFPKKFNKKYDRARKVWVPVIAPTMDFIDYLKKSMPIHEFSAQYLNRPMAGDQALFKPEYFKRWTQRPQNLFISMAIDPAISEQRGADFTAISVVGMDEKGNWFVLDTLKGRWPVSQIVDHIFTTYSKWRPSIVALETNTYQKVLKFYLEEQMRVRKVHFPITELKHYTNQSKENRIKALEPYYRDGLVYHASWMKSLEDELESFPYGAHDDEADCLSFHLETLVRGTPESDPGVPEGSWEALRREAEAARHPWKDFFDESVTHGF